MYTVLTLSITIFTSLYFIIQATGTVVSSESNLLQQPQQNQSYIANLTGDSNIPPVNTNATGIVKFITNDHYYDNNELYYEINLTNIHSDVGKVDIHMGNKNENGPAVITLYQTTTSYLQKFAAHLPIQNMKKPSSSLMEQFLPKLLNLDH